MSQQPRYSAPRDAVNPRSRVALLLYKIAVILLYVLAVGHMYGTFTNGLPPKFNYVYTVGWLCETFSHLKETYISLWLFVEVFKDLTLEKAALILRRSQCCVWIVFVLIIYFITMIGIYHHSK